MISDSTNTQTTRHRLSANSDARAESDAYQEVSPSQVQQWMRAGEAVLIDVREPDEFAREHISGAHLVALSRFDPTEAAALVKSGQRLVLQCRSGRRSADAAQMTSNAIRRGVSVFIMAGGIQAWKNENLSVEVNMRISRISVMRQVQIVIGFGVLAGCVLAWFVDPLFIGIPAFFGAGLVFAGATGTCALATLVGMMPWNQAVKSGGPCARRRCS